MGRIKLALDVARKYLGRPYVWAGDDPMGGFDCSGYVLEVLKSVGLFPPNGDTTADGLMNWGFLEVDMDEEALQPGQLVFWGTDRATHVEMVYTISYDGEVFTIGASGGGSRTRDLQDAIDQDSYVKIRPMRGGILAARDPFAQFRGNLGGF